MQPKSWLQMLWSMIWRQGISDLKCLQTSHAGLRDLRGATMKPLAVTRKPGRQILVQPRFQEAGCRKDSVELALQPRHSSLDFLEPLVGVLASAKLRQFPRGDKIKVGTPRLLRHFLGPRKWSGPFKRSHIASERSESSSKSQVMSWSRTSWRITGRHNLEPL